MLRVIRLAARLVLVVTLDIFVWKALPGVIVVLHDDVCLDRRLVVGNLP